ncbi:MAG TPA: phosphate ABC transporter permease PstA, partial [Candidatus Methylacidiphilales bacterium]|nr:phosphate ABC transporter permease PstA [Candidatus Methylacidiphilales bacterium]
MNTTNQYHQSKAMDLRHRRRWRSLFSRGMDGLVGLLTLAALVPLGSVLYMVISRGAGHFRWSMLWQLPPAAGMDGGGFGNALVGTLLLVGIGTLVSVPAGILTAIFLTEYSQGSRSARIIRFSAKILSGLPSILAGVFIFAVLVTTTHAFSVIAGGLALSILMLPIVILSTEEALLRVPRIYREASLALGANRTQTVLFVTLPAGASMIITGVMLAIARAAGETAPIIFTALISNFWIRSLTEPTASMAVLIYNFSSQP